jgi:glycosyltransferase involved in cell wall biosynthesis
VSKEFHFYYFRNAGTGPKAGGGVHTAQMAYQSSQNYPVVLVSPHTEKNYEKYPVLKDIPEIKFRDFFNPLKINILDYLYRSIRMMLPVGISKTNATRVFVASSHFLPDVMGIAFRTSINSIKVAYVFHLISSHRTLSSKTFLSHFQEWLSLSILKIIQAKIMVINEETKQELIKKGFSGDKIYLTKCPVSNPGVSPKPQSKKQYLLSFCARMIKQKGVYDFLEVVETLQKQGYNKPSVMIGDGAELKNIKQIAQEKELNIEFTGFADEIAKFEKISSSQIFCFPSYEEGWGIVITEALSVGVDVIAYELDIYESIFQDNISLVRLGNISELSKKVQTTLEDFQAENLETKQFKLVQFSQQFDSFTIAQNELSFILSRCD